MCKIDKTKVNGENKNRREESEGRIGGENWVTCEGVWLDIALPWVLSPSEVRGRAMGGGEGAWVLRVVDVHKHDMFHDDADAKTTTSFQMMTKILFSNDD